MKIINGSELAEKIKDKIAKQIYELNGPRPNLAIVLIGERPDSELYVRLKETEAKKVGVDTHLYRCPANISERELLEMIKCLNEDEQIDGILVQLPLPAGIDTDTIIMAVDPTKDVDGFQPDNLEKLLNGCDRAEIMPPVFGAALAILKSIDCEINNKQVCIISNSDIFGKSLAHVLICRGAEAEAIKSDDENLAEHARQADILISAVGRPGLIKKGMIKPDAVIIDVGISKVKGQTVGDVDFEEVKDKAGYLTPVPGGVGPLTIALALKNTLEIFKKRRG